MEQIAMTLTLDTLPGSATDDTSDFRPGFTGLRCGNCGADAPTAPTFVCAQCFGPLRATYDYALVRDHLTHAAVAARPRNLWRYAELLPVERIPTDGLSVGCSPL